MPFLIHVIEIVVGVVLADLAMILIKRLSKSPYPRA